MVKVITTILLWWTITVEYLLVENLIARLCLLVKTKGHHCLYSSHVLTGWTFTVFSLSGFSKVFLPSFQELLSIYISKDGVAVLDRHGSAHGSVQNLPLVLPHVYNIYLLLYSKLFLAASSLA